MAASPEALADPAADAQKRKDAELATKWLKAISVRRSKESKWRTRAKKVVERFRDDRDLVDENQTKFNILWANTEVMKPAIFARMPVADVRRRYLTRDPVARTAAMILERALSYCMDSYDFKDTLDRAEEDYLLPGRGQAIVCYKPYFKQNRVAVEPLPPDEDASGKADVSGGADPLRPAEAGADGAPVPADMPGAGPSYPPGTQFDDQGAFQLEEQKLYEEVYTEYQAWDLYVFGEAKQRCKVPWEAYGDRLTKDEVHEEYPDFADWKSLTYTQAKEDDYQTDDERPPPKVIIWKVWHRASRKMIVLAEGYKDTPILVVDDPLQLENFFPTPEPLYSLRTNGSDIPKPEYLMYQDQAIELDILVDRERQLTQALKYRGVYDKLLEETAKIRDLTNGPDNFFIPIANFSQIAEKGGIESLIDTMPLEEIAQVLGWLVQRIEVLKQQIYEIYGISDIVRGASKASETLGAQQLKAQYAGMRISTRQERFQRFIRDILRIKAEIIAEHFSPQTLQLMTGIDVIPDAQYDQLKSQDQLQANMVSESEFMGACQMIKSDKLRGFRIDIETDSTIPVDRANEQQNRIAFIGAVGQYLTGILPAVESGAIPVKLAREGLLFVVRGFKVGTELEEVLEELGENSDEAQQLQQMKQQLAQMQQEIADLTKQNQQLKSDAQAKLQAAQVDSQIRGAAASQDLQIEGAEAQNDMAIDRAKGANDIEIARKKAASAPRPQSGFGGP